MIYKKHTNKQIIVETMEANTRWFNITLMRFEGGYFCVGKRLETNSKRIIIYAFLSVYGENSITNKACVAKIGILVQTM